MIKDIKTDFYKYAKYSCNVSEQGLDKYSKSMSPCNDFINPMILEERQLNVVPLDIFSRLMYDRIIFLGSVINNDVSNIISSQLMYLDSIGESDIKLYINSPGGVVCDGFSIIDVMNYVNSPVSTTGMGLCASMAAVLLSNGEKGKRFILPHSKVMIHQPMGGAEGQASDIEITAREINKTKKELFTVLSENTGKSIKQIEKDSDRDFWFNAEEALAYGLVDNIIKVNKK